MSVESTHDYEALVRPEEGEVSRRIFADPEVHAEELERIFARSWLFVAHASEIPSAGDYVTRLSGTDPVVVTRTEDDQIRVFHNSCRHRGMQVCRVDRGNTAHFRCPYHGWTYKNDGRLIGVPAHKYAYGELDRSRLGLLEPPHVRVLHGLVFVNWDPDAPSLEDYLGDMLWYLEILFARTEQGIEVVGSPQRSLTAMNWKLGADNFSGDGYHVAMTHRHALELELFGGGTMLGHTIVCEGGHTVRFQNFPPQIPLPHHLALPDEVMESMRRTLDPDQLDAIDAITVMHGNVFPNFSFVDAIFTTTGDPDIPPVSFQNIRLWQPASADETELWSWVTMAKETPDWWRDASLETFVRSHGIAGTFDQDDIEVWTNITAANRGPIARRQTFNYEIGLRNPRPDPDWIGPGTAYAADYNEANQRAFYSTWRGYMQSRTGVKA
ncbi:MAG: aromatic ring-hydroxylating dioxygenase subunit alpha [Actinobacteria bacterium]|nr:aromatic ring-hydroxylating dioxygenase subunit alpha [Actinomycetota bacterium]